MKIRFALIMAAGRGMRMMPLTDSIPKAMAPYNGTTLIANGIEKIHRQVPHVYITVGYKGAILAQHVIEHNVTGIFNTEGKDNAWWIFNTLMKELDEPVYVLTCDNVIDLDFPLIEKEYFDFGAPACMVIPVQPIAGLEGDFIFHEKNVVTELTRAKKSEIYCSGIQVLNPKKINSLLEPADNFYQVWSGLMQHQQLYCGDVYPSRWYAVDTLEQLNSLA
jgi:NDP-sugar pyrophosphorylase family protein